MYIYVITNKITGKIYIGQHKGANLKQYLQKKFYYARNQKTGSSYLFNAMRKHPDYRDWSINSLVEVDTKAALNIWEQVLIELWDTRNPEVGYNICKGGEGYTGPFTEDMKKAWCDGNKRYWDERKQNLVGQTFSRLTVLSEADTQVDKRSWKSKRKWNCVCSCGNHTRVTTDKLKSGGIKSCGCLTSETATKRVGRTDLIGKVFSKLTVEEDAGRCTWGKKLWKCRCECGNYTTIRTGALKSGRLKSCGCLVNSKNIDIKAEAIRLRVEEDKRLTEISRKLGVPAPTVCGWLKPYPLANPVFSVVSPIPVP